ncbi:flagellar basal body protein FliL [Paracoccus sp. S-4012]|uniref:flagellar basal body protein FliL n=1 Tax=Paracoccus sp. S-4012 TaxID=2665648 RepID=UPI0012AF8B70|nr:flagellar basal body protein FliL [Paracoccus sp. S-4012]MRX49705.1 flagellar basal body protein FliL [Paracoccus sp. S-4012]
MTDLALTDAAAAAAPAPRRRRRLAILTLPVLAAGLGFGSSYLGYWSPGALLQGGGSEAAPQVVFVDVAPINVTLPDARPRTLHLVVKLETTEAAKSRIEALSPRVIDSFNTFVTGIAPAAFERRGILDVVREELGSRARLALGEDLPVEVLIIEFGLK